MKTSTKKNIGVAVLFTALGSLGIAAQLENAKNDPLFSRVTHENCSDTELYNQSWESGIDFCHAPAPQ